MDPWVPSADKNGFTSKWRICLKTLRQTTFVKTCSVDLKIKKRIQNLPTYKSYNLIFFRTALNFWKIIKMLEDLRVCRNVRKSKGIQTQCTSEYESYLWDGDPDLVYYSGLFLLRGIIFPEILKKTRASSRDLNISQFLSWTSF